MLGIRIDVSFYCRMVSRDEDYPDLELMRSGAGADSALAYEAGLRKGIS